jgi:hypothetical protein
VRTNSINSPNLQIVLSAYLALNSLVALCCAKCFNFNILIQLFVFHQELGGSARAYGRQCAFSYLLESTIMSIDYALMWKSCI